MYRRELQRKFTFLRLAVGDRESRTGIGLIRTSVELDVASSLRRGGKIDKGIAVDLKLPLVVSRESDCVGRCSQIASEGLQVVGRLTWKDAGVVELFRVEGSG